MVRQQQTHLEAILKEIDVKEMSLFFEKIMLDMNEEKIRFSFTRKKATEITKEQKRLLKNVERAIAIGNVNKKCSNLLEILGNGECAGMEAEYTAIRFIAKALFANEKLFLERDKGFILAILGSESDKTADIRSLIGKLDDARKRFLAGTNRN